MDNGKGLAGAQAAVLTLARPLTNLAAQLQKIAYLLSAKWDALWDQPDGCKTVVKGKDLVPHWVWTYINAFPPVSAGPKLLTSHHKPSPRVAKAASTLSGTGKGRRWSLD